MPDQYQAPNAQAPAQSAQPNSTPSEGSMPTTPSGRAVIRQAVAGAVQEQPQGLAAGALKSVDHHLKTLEVQRDRTLSGAGSDPVHPNVDHANKLARILKDAQGIRDGLEKLREHLSTNANLPDARKATQKWVELRNDLEGKLRAIAEAKISSYRIIASANFETESRDLQDLIGMVNKGAQNTLPAATPQQQANAEVAEITAIVRENESIEKAAALDAELNSRGYVKLANMNGWRKISLNSGEQIAVILTPRDAQNPAGSFKVEHSKLGLSREAELKLIREVLSTSADASRELKNMGFSQSDSQLLRVSSDQKGLLVISETNSAVTFEEVSPHAVVNAAHVNARLKELTEEQRTAKLSAAGFEVKDGRWQKEIHLEKENRHYVVIATSDGVVLPGPALTSSPASTREAPPTPAVTPAAEMPDPAPVPAPQQTQQPQRPVEDKRPRR